ncbi:hypothetical protein EC915_101620 [Pseudomonas sp. LP_7_YM]|nr:hypothetical protein EC915_101620 [Pseudomonas sp. LP_7_YM]
MISEAFVKKVFAVYEGPGSGGLKRIKQPATAASEYQLQGS